MSESFDINALREEAKTRWLRPVEVYYILQNHESFPITPEPPKKPPSGSLFLYNRRVNRYFRRDGHAWRRKKDGRTVGEAHERLKVGNVDALSCYYAHGEQNPGFQRRCFWMLEPAYEHIVLVQYREVAEGRYYSSQRSNGQPESLSSLSYPNAIHGNQYHSSASGISEGGESHQSYSNLSSLTEVTSYSVNKEHNRESGTLLSIPELGKTCLEQHSEVYQADNGNTANKSGLNVALRKIVEQLSLGDDGDDYIYSNQVPPLGSVKNVEAAADNQLKQIQREATQNGLGRNIVPSWEDMLHCSSGLPTSSIYQLDSQYQQNLEYETPGSLDSSDLRIQLSAAKRFLLGPEDFINSPSSNFVLGTVGNSGTGTFSAHDGRLECSVNPDWKTKTPLASQSNSQGSEVTELFQFEPCSRADTGLSLGQKRLFNIREICPEWAFSYEITKVIITGDFLCDPLNSCWAVMFGNSEVPAEMVQPGVLRCHTPLHSSGKLTLCITSVLSAGVGINFRDSNGWTALHWAAYFGREKMVATLLAAGASATAVTDPTAQDPVGKTAAFLASERGHMGLAGYLSEVSLTSHLASLTIEESEISKGSAVFEAERAVESISQRNAERQGGTEDELSMKDSLAAVRNAAQAAARIQNAFRAFSFRKRQHKTARLKDECGMTQEDIDELAAAAASRRYKGWKGRKTFLNMRRNAVKIQAHIRGHQVRKKYKTFVSTVSVLEKVILRWRRKGQGLRGFRAEQPAMIVAEEEEEDDDVDFDDDEATRIFRRQKVDEALKEAVSRVLSMVDSPEARMQYRRMLEEFRQATAELGGSEEVTSLFNSELVGLDSFMVKEV
ncbi:hypothetical protein PR202_gb15889 [Eleusine coracana subsp. coracana]|uniref:CG-1 domain-containing protein n=1 Tax=Eleusine coracana subsp. coracana TaxID=191504 RepID=A0AAV5F070_ELECO|nr:hypothetical protein PR202_gb15889 [Eleusine coracana subsp. coracana]